MQHTTPPLAPPTGPPVAPPLEPRPGPRFPAAASARDGALALESALEDGLATRVEPFRSGTALFRKDLPRVSELNELRVEALDEGLDAAGLMEFVDHLQAGLPQRSIRVVDDGVAEHLRPTFAAAGWVIVRRALMVQRRRPDRRIDTSAVEEVELARLRQARETTLRRDHRDVDSAIDMLAAGELQAEGAVTRAFAALVGAEVAAYAVARVAAGGAKLTEVDALGRAHGHGLGRAVVAFAADELRRSGAPLVVVEARDDTWAKWVYHRLGFDEVGTIHRFVRPWGDEAR